jgi:hypothetical protein
MLPTDPLFHKPKSIIAAKNLIYATMFLGVINWALSEWATDLKRYSQLQGICTIAFILLITFALAKQIGLAKKWARTVYLVLFLLGLIVFPFTILPLFKANIVIGLIAALEAILQLFALKFLFAEESTEWFNRVHYVDQPPS